ncbi:hypothetical protein T310_2533 [Rasamsonia emersonii CBS 393.64]|uniref:Uncharacterized protein n=1 Tax=Rasamsonia emersonii (strain ATCC 16479 / CBS 393.64 / IMI 116815) TaxID=1408163 RepID=A0A0F4YYU4_RASE3|nr:hypothetical protein T310_2533 [Rasamsonia emersonii CBS 393.64]KKA23467.1 hypothetical protein T310_2533 [Rasamsonia emersonii CBS 393.64]
MGSGTDLFTFCPPGPLDRLNDTSQIWRGIDLELSFASHSLASLSSSSSCSSAFRAAARLDAKDLTAARCAPGMARGRATAKVHARLSDEIISSAYCLGYKSSKQGRPPAVLGGSAASTKSQG